MKIISWNINSIRYRLNLLAKLIEISQAEVICLQETKVIDQLFPTEFFKNLGYPHLEFCGQKSYNGVAIISKLPIYSVNKFDFIQPNEARHISAIINEIEIHNFYIPAGGELADPVINPKFAFKLNYLDKITDWFTKHKNQADELVLLGDLNIAPLVNDVWSHNQLKKEVSHTPIEIKKLMNLKNSLNWLDTSRLFVPAECKLYSWWSYRNQNWQKSNRGRRLDHMWISPALDKKLENSVILSSARGWNKPSDHVPLILTLKK